MARLVSGSIQFEPLTRTRFRMTTSCVVNVIGRDWTILPGDETDLSSYPVFARPLYDPLEAALAGAWHDQRYIQGDVTRKEADHGWYELAIVGSRPETRMPKWKAKIGLWGLRVGGWVPWNKYRSAG